MPTTPNQRRQLVDDGFVLLESAVPADLLATWRDIAADLERAAVDAHARGARLPGACVLDTEAGPSLIRYDDLHLARVDAALDLLACPMMLAIAREFCGRGAVPLQLDLVYKQSNTESTIAWHQGAPHPRSYPYLNVGIYLDDADAGDGCVRYVPGTQHELHDIATLTEHFGWDPPGVVEQPARAGDILVQDMMILHGSPSRSRGAARRTIYVEIRPVAGIIESGWQSNTWAERRERWMALIVRRGGAGDWPTEWMTDLPNDLGDDSEEMALIGSHREPPIPAVYGAPSQPDHPPG